MLNSKTVNNSVFCKHKILAFICLMDVAGPGSCPLEGFVVSGVESSDSATRELIIVTTS
jgi:hypothetical protein